MKAAALLMSLLLLAPASLAADAQPEKVWQSFHKN